MVAGSAALRMLGFRWVTRLSKLLLLLLLLL